MTSKVYVITDLGPGDGGKGGVVHAVAKSQRAHTIIKRGGAQGSHGVLTSAGKKFAFSQWGCGTFDGIPTHISEQMIISPQGLLNEAESLQNDVGIEDPFSLLTVDTRALVATPLHGIASRLFELCLTGNPRGTIGTGVGQAYRDFVSYPDLALTAGDLAIPDLRDRLYAIRENIRSYLLPVVESTEFLWNDQSYVREDMGLLADDGFVEYIYERFQQAARLTQVVKPEYFGEVILAKAGCAVVETSHGVLTDRLYGFSPHTSAIRTLPSITRRVLDDAGYGGKVVNLGVTRAYAIRHGAGPLPTNDPSLAEHLLPGSHKQDNRWQGEVRVGALDGVLLRYAIDVCGGPLAFDGLAITWFDQIVQNGEWLLCDSYSETHDDTVFTPKGDIRVASEPSEAHQEQLTTALQNVRPIVERLPVDSSIDHDGAYTLCAKTVYDMTGVPVRMVSMGPTERDKLMK